MQSNSLPESILALYPAKEPPAPPSWKRTLRLLPLLLLIPAGLLLPRLAAGHAALIEEYYIRLDYPAIKGAILSVTKLLPFSLAELIIYALCVLVPILLISSAVKSVRLRAGQYFVRRVIALGVVFGLGLNLFYITWGFAYQRKPLAERMNLAVGPRDTSELAAVAEDLANEAAYLRTFVYEDARGVATYSAGENAALDSLTSCYDQLASLYPQFSGQVTAAKPVLHSKALSRAGIAGVYVGLTAEANVNVDQPDMSIPHAAAHEMAHQLGVASENEAEFTAFLACLCSPDPFIRYSGVMQMLVRAGNALNGADSELYALLRESYDPLVLRDLTDEAAYWAYYDGPVADAVDAVNDGYLKHNGQTSGVKSYGEAVDLLLAWYESQN